MSLLVLGLSHRTAPLDLLERATVSGERTAELRTRLGDAADVREAVVISTCNRIEVYAEVDTFHGGVAQIGEALSQVTGVPSHELREHLYVHHEDRAVAHTFTVACGLDSMAIGEAQILGQMRSALAVAQADDELGPHLNSLFQRALRVGKKAHTTTGIDDVSLGLVDAGLRHAEQRLGPLAGLHVLVVGAGAMSGLAVATAVRAGVASVTVTNRTAAKATRLAAHYDAATAPWGGLEQALAAADVVLTCTGAAGRIIDLDLARAASARRAGRPQVYVDLALPRDVEEAVAAEPGLDVIGLAELGAILAGDGAVPPQVEAVRALVAGETTAYLVHRRQQHVAPTVTALRRRAAEVVDRELARLDTRVPDLDDTTRAEVRQALHRTVEKLLHTPTVRIKQLAGASSSGDYAAALSELFDLDPQRVAAVSAPSPDATPTGSLPAVPAEGAVLPGARP